jgi:hypothetical protein
MTMPTTTLWILIVQVMASTAMATIAWFVERVHYPLFVHVQTDGTGPRREDFVSLARARAYHDENLRRTRPIVLVPMLVEAATAVWLVLFPPASIGRGAAIAGLALVAVVVLSTALVQVPLHETLRSGEAPPGTLDRLVRTTRLRTAAWTARAVLAAWMLHTSAIAG